MKRNLLSSAIIVTTMSLGLTGCDDKKAETETLPPTNSQPAAPAPEAKPTEAPVAKAEAKPETPVQPMVDEQAAFDERMDVYIKCYNKLQIPVQRSLARYADQLKDFRQGPIGRKRTVYGIYSISESNLAEYEEGIRSAVVLTLVLQPIDGAAVSYINAAVALNNTINKMNRYYTQENYKDDAFAKRKALHQTFLKDLETFGPIAESYHAATREINDKRQLTELRNIEEREGKTSHYYSLAVVISAKQISSLTSQDKFDAGTAMKKVPELEVLVAQAKEADKGGMNFSLINSAGQHQLETKKCIHHVRDKVPYSDRGEGQLQDANPSWMIEDSFPRALHKYNEMADDYSSLYQTFSVINAVSDAACPAQFTPRGVTP